MSLARPRVHLDDNKAQQHRAEIARSTLPLFDSVERSDGTERPLVRSTGQMTLTPSSPFTTIVDAYVRSGDGVFMTPTTLNASAEMPRVTTVANGQFTMVHSNNSQTDRTYLYVVIG